MLIWHFLNISSPTVRGWEEDSILDSFYSGRLMVRRNIIKLILPKRKVCHGNTGLRCVFGNHRIMERLISWDSVLKWVTENITSVISHLECGDYLVFILETETEICPQSVGTKQRQGSEKGITRRHSVNQEKH